MSNTRIWIRRVHKWLGLLIGLQVVLWLSGGVVMSLIPIDMVRGESWVAQQPAELSEHLPDFDFPLSRIPGENVLAASAGVRNGQAVWLHRYADGSRHVLDGTSGMRLPELEAGEAGAIAVAAHVASPAILAVAAVEKAEGEIRGATLPLWRVDLDDRWQSSVYVDPVTGRIVAARNTLWRIYDFFWMLHIMDYDTRDDFNNNLLRSASGVGWFIGLSGLWMLFYSFRRRDFVLLDKAVEKLRSRSKG